MKQIQRPIDRGHNIDFVAFCVTTTVHRNVWWSVRFPRWCVAGLLATISVQAGEPDAAGHWEGAIKLPSTELEVQVDLDREVSGQWSGIIDIPVQSLRGFKLGSVTVSGTSVSFAMPSIPGDPKFAGTLAADGKSLAGNFTQSGQKFPFKLDRRDRPTSPTGATPSKGMPGKGLVGHWQGSLRPTPIVEMRLVLEVSAVTGGQLGGVMMSVDQGKDRIPITAISEKEGAVKLELPRIGGSFEGRLSGDGSEIAGDWKQGGQNLSLVFRRLEKALDFSRPQDPKKPCPVCRRGGDCDERERREAGGHADDAARRRPASGSRARERFGAAGSRRGHHGSPSVSGAGRSPHPRGHRRFALRRPRRWRIDGRFFQSDPRRLHRGRARRSRVSARTEGMPSEKNRHHRSQRRRHRGAASLPTAPGTPPSSCCSRALACRWNNCSSGRERTSRG